ncbi:MAG: hypothetical protein K9G26_05705 [Emcibacter sp.]|nr:hypothetical protein [Emcibacter sp.]
MRKNTKKLRSSLKLSTSIMVISLSLCLSSAAAQEKSQLSEMPSKEIMWQMILEQQEQIKRLERIVGITNKKIDETTIKVAEAEKKIEATGDAIDQISSPNNMVSQSATSVGGYTELHYNAGKKDQIDLHRFVVFLSHEFNEKIRFFSEFEIEHSISGEGQVGEVEIEQAYIEMDINENHKASLGVQLIPVGIINETHEPPSFYGVERNNVETNIIPATWWEAGAKLSGNLSDNIGYDIMIHSGLDTTGYGYKIRNGRKKVGEAPWKNSALTARAKWHVTNGIDIAASFQYQTDITQSSLDDEKASATLFEIHTDIKQGVSENSTLGLRALYAQWNVNSDTAKSLGRNIQRGWYVEPSYKIALRHNHAVGFFARYSLWDNEAGDHTDSAYKQTMIGINYWPHERVVLKMDYQIDDFTNNNKEDRRINLGVGLQF